LNIVNSSEFENSMLWLYNLKMNWCFINQFYFSVWYTF